MSHKVFELDDLRRILRERAGVDQDVDISADILDTGFEDLGYDSIALMETAAQITREFELTIDDTLLSEARTPRLLLELVNGS